MMVASWMMVAGLLLGQSRSTLAVKWVGQDGHDFVNIANQKEEPSEIQDIHLVLTGLPADREIKEVIVAGAGGNEWQVNGPSQFYRAALRRDPGSRTADLYLEPVRIENGRMFELKLTYDDGRTFETRFLGKKADPKLRMPDVALTAKWIGQERQDWAAAGPNVGPDGFQDARIALAKLSPKNEVRAALLEGPGGARWEFGRNIAGHHNAEIVRDAKDPSQADLFFQPERDLSGQKLKLSITYADGKTDAAIVTAGRSDPKLRMPQALAVLPRLTRTPMTARWLGQDATPDTAPGDVHVAISEHPTGPIAAAVLTDSIRGCWVYKANDQVPFQPEPDAQPLTLKRGPGRHGLDLFFAPYRDESDATFTLRLVFASGEMAAGSFSGGACDPDLRAPGVASTRTVAKPGDDLNDLANRFTTVQLTKGTYRLTKPLVLSESVTLTGEPGTTLLFAQESADPPWPAAITIHKSRTTLEGFAIRFAGPIRWNEDVHWGPAILGATPLFDDAHKDLRAGLTFSKLDIEGPPAANPATWAGATRIMRMVNARNGKIVGCTLRGGMIELFEGPWQILDNDYRGTAPGTWSPSVFTVHNPHDVTIRNNRAKPVGPSGKTWRFLILTGTGFNTRVEENTIEGIGPRDDDTIESMNMPEVILTEGYKIQFEGKPAAISGDGRVVRVFQTFGEPTRTGDVVAIVAGPNAGQWRKVAQAINPTAFLLESPLPAGTEAITVTSGFINLLVQGNTIDTRGGSKASDLQLPGNHFGLQVRNNRLFGGSAFQFTANATELPRIWGWSHAPYFGGVVEGNTIEDSTRGGSIDVEHNDYSKTGKGRTYLDLTFRNNTFRWTESFLSRRASKGEKGLPPALTIGSSPSFDPGELVLHEQGNTLQAPSGVRTTAAVKVVSGTINGKRIADKSLPLPTGLAPSSTPVRSNSAPGAGPAAEPSRAARSGTGRSGATAR
jgi:hypothetical protein